MNFKAFIITVLFVSGLLTATATNMIHEPSGSPEGSSGFTDAGAFGFSSNASGIDHAKALQKAIDKGGTIVVSQPGIYKIATTLYIGSHTSLLFGNGVSLKKVNEAGAFAQLIINKGAITRSYDEHITVEGLHVAVNGVDITVTNSRIRNTGFRFTGNEAFPEYLKDNIIPDYHKTSISIHGCIFGQDGEMILIDNTAKGKEIELKTSSSMELGKDFSAKIVNVGGNIHVESDLTGLKN
jgi:hypothetical protein